MRALSVQVLAVFALVSAGGAACRRSNLPKPSVSSECAFHSDCPNSQVCSKGRCFPTVSCLERKNCRNVPVCADETCICGQDNRCLPVCVTDGDCGRDGLCLNGVCERYPGGPGGAPFESGPRTTLSAGIARVELDFPLGVSLAGYEGRRGPTTPYQASLGGSSAWFGKPDVRAVALSDGAETLVILRIPTCWSTDEMLAAVTAKVAQRTGKDLSGRIVTSAPHSHAYPARYWHLLVGYNFGLFGYDEFDFEIFDRLTTSFADAAIMALEGLAPARFGYAVVDDFDPQDLIHKDRRPENDLLPGYLKKDDRMILMRIDDAAGNPLAVLANFGIHGTIFDGTNPMVTGDAPGGIEEALTLGASEKYGRQVLGVFLQGNAGDIAPAGDELGHSRIEQMQLIGRRAFRVMGAALDRIETTSDVPLSIASARVPLSRAALGYAKTEFFDRNAGCEGTPPYFRYGAFQCVKNGSQTSPYRDGDLECIFSVECLTDGYPIPQFMKTDLTVMKLGDLLLATMPGEPLTRFGRDLEERLLAAVPSARAAGVLGYSQDHQFYLLNVEDWFQGGYEPSMDIWGWKLAPYLADRSIEVARSLAKPPAERMSGDPDLKPSLFLETPAPRAAITDTEGRPEEVLEDTRPKVERFERATFRWRGGHPGLDRPRVVLEKEEGSGFADVHRSGGWVYDDTFFEMLVAYEGKCTADGCSEHAWRVTWDERRDFPAGRYRFRAEGRAQTQGTARAYVARSSAFDLVPSSRLLIEGLTSANGRIEGRISDPSAVVYVQDGAKKTMESTAQLLRSELAPAELGVPLPDTPLLVQGLLIQGSMRSTLSATVATETIHEERFLVTGYDESGNPTKKSMGIAAATRFTLPAAARAPFFVTLQLIDPAGNFGTVTATISAAAH